MKKVVRLTESDLVKLVKKVLKEQSEEHKMIMAIQKFLNNRYKLNLKVDGLTGENSETAKAIERYQIEKKIYPSDGIAGHDTIEQMRKDGLGKFEDKFLGLF